MSDLRQTYSQVLRYLDSSLDDDPIYDWILQETAERGIPEIQITPVQGRLLRLLAQLVGARRILEIGTLSGYSGVWLARALADDGRLITLEADPKHVAMARESFARAGVAERVQIIQGPALTSLSSLALDAPLDLVFIDADKPNNPNYFAWAWEHTRSGGLILVDNVIANGQVAHPNGSEYARSIREFNAAVLERHQERATIVPFFKEDEDNLDGLLIVRLP